MISREDRIASKLMVHAKRAVEVDHSNFQHMLELAEQGWTPVEEPESYRWFFIKGFPVKNFNITMKDIVKGLPKEDRAPEYAQHDRIVEILTRGGVQWPAFVTASGVIFEGYHRIAAHRTMEAREMDVVVAVEKPGNISERAWAKAWNRSFPVSDSSGFSPHHAVK